MSVRLRIVLALGVVGLAAALWASGALDAFRDAEHVKALLLSWGGWGYALYVVTFTLLEPMGLPGIVFVVPASLVWPKPIAFALSLVAAIGAGIVGFTFARFIARDWVARHLPERFRRFDDLLAARSLEAVVLVRLVFFMAPPAHWVLGLSKVRFGAFVLGSAIGFVPGVLVLTYLGGSLVQWLGRQPRWAWIAVGVIAVALIGLRRWRLRRARASSG